MMRVCVLAQASPASWVEHYIAAFRAACDTLVIGPAPTPAQLEAWDRDQAPPLPQPHDIIMDFQQDTRSLEAVLPAGWRPDLVIGIAGIGGEPLYQGVATLPWPTIFLTIDTWQCLLDYQEARAYDQVYAAQREFVPHLAAAGAAEVAWLPLAADPARHHPVAAPPICDIAFAGSAGLPVHQPRRELLTWLAQSFSLLARERVYGEDLCAFFGQGRLAFNHAAVQELNMRIFEALAMGCALLTNAEARFNGLDELFQDGEHLIVYQDRESLKKQVEFYLAHASERKTLAARGRAEVLEKHTYAHRVARILEDARRRSWARQPDRPAFAYRSEAIADYLPTLPGVVADYGLGLDLPEERRALSGITRLIGVAQRPPATAAIRRRYTEVLPLAAMPFGEIDTLVLDAPTALGLPLEELLKRAHGLLRPGGQLLMRFEGGLFEAASLKPTVEGLGPWLQDYDFHLRIFGPPLEGGSHIILARKRTRRLASIVAEVFGRLQVPELDIGELLARIPAGW